MHVTRRTLLAGMTTLGTLAGCLGDRGGPSSSSADPDPGDGYPPAFEETPAARSIDASAFETTTVDGRAVPLAPIDAVYYWYRRGEARFADARGETQYERSHVRGAVWSPAPDGRRDDPVLDWPTTDRIVCYCGCPHHLSSMRAASLLADGYAEVYVIDEGFWEWHGRDYPLAGTEVETRPATYVVRGTTAPAFAGETAWARHEPSGQREATVIGADGAYRLALTFADVTPDSIVRVETPAYTVAAPVRELTSAVVTGE